MKRINIEYEYITKYTLKERPNAFFITPIYMYTWKDKQACTVSLIEIQKAQQCTHCAQTQVPEHA